MGTLALTELLGQPVVEASGEVCGRVREVALTPADDRARVSNLIVRTKNGDRLLPFSAVVSAKRRGPGRISRFGVGGTSI